MFIKYYCKKCGNTRVFSNKKDFIVCNKCGSNMYCNDNNKGIIINSSEEARYLADEALFNSIGDRISKKSSQGVQV